jgi:hypothetical protein
MNVELNLGELELIVEALDQKHDALSSGGTEVLREEHERTHDLSLEEVHQAYDSVLGRQLGSAVSFRIWRPSSRSASAKFMNGSIGR